MKDNTATAYFKMTTTYISKHKVKKLHMLMILSALLYIHDEIIFVTFNSNKTDDEIIS
jgi:hypothetical protein